MEAMALLGQRKEQFLSPLLLESTSTQEGKKESKKDRGDHKLEDVCDLTKPLL
jgi:hypothetical protein